MKQSEVKHILDTSEEPEENQLVFTYFICSDDGSKKSSTCNLQPCDYTNVKHLTGNLYYAYNDDACSRGSLFVGEFK